MSTSKSADDTIHSALLVEFLNTLPSAHNYSRHARTRDRKGPTSCTDTYLKALWEDCWLPLGPWWAVCLILEFGLRCAFFIRSCAPSSQFTAHVQVVHSNH